MKILVDGQLLARHEPTYGAGECFKNLLEQWVADDLAVEWLIAVRREFDLEALNARLRGRLQPVKIATATRGASADELRQSYTAQLQAIVDENSVDAYWHPAPLWTSLLLPVGLQNTSIHLTLAGTVAADVAAADWAELPGEMRAEHERRLQAIPVWANRLLFTSESARTDWERLSPAAAKRGQVIGMAADQTRFSALSAPNLRTKTHVLLPLGVDAERWLPMAMRGFAQWTANSAAELDGLKLIVLTAGNEKLGTLFDRLASTLDINRRVEWIDRPSEAEVVRLYRHACLVWQPASGLDAELSIQQALACGVPVVTSPRSAGELGAEWCLPCQPDQVDDCARALQAGLASWPDVQRRTRQIDHARRWHWPAVALAYTRAAHGRETGSSIEVKSRPKVAFVSPWPSQRTGVAHFNQGLVSELRKELDLTLYVEDVRLCDGERHGLPLRPLNELTQDRQQFQTTLYHIGNNAKYHRQIYKLAYDVPGVAVFHDYNLHDLLCTGFLLGGEDEYYFRTLEDGYGIPRAPFNLDDVTRLGIPYCHALAKRSLATIVHSRWVKDQMPGVPNVHYVPLGGVAVGSQLEQYQTAGAALRQQWSIPANQLVISTLGFVNRLKRVPSILEAVRDLRELGYPVHFLVAGSISDPSLQIKERIARLGIEANVTITGFVSDEELHAAIAMSDVVLNLRCPSMGETSGTLLQAFGHGKACIVSDYEQFADLPDSICWKAAVDDAEVPELVAMLEHLLRNPATRSQLGNNAARWMENYSSRGVAVEKYVDVVRQVMTHAKSRQLPSEIVRAA